MPFLYVYVCDLLEKLDELHNCPLPLELNEKTNKIAVKWLGRHRARLNEFSVDSQAVIMMLRPEQRTDRDYGLDAERLEQLIARVLYLPRKLHEELRIWRNGPAHGDLAACVQRVMDKLTLEIATRATANKVTVEDIDRALLSIATHNPNSSPEVRALATKVKTHDSIELLGNFYRSLGGREAKWLTRLILKDYGPVKFPTRLNLSSHNAFLPRCVQMNAELSTEEEFPVLREGTSVIRGTSSANAATNQLPTTPITTAEKVIVGVRSTHSMANQLPTFPMTATETVRREITSAHSTVNQLPTPPKTAPQPPSSAPVPNPARPACGLPRTREPLASLAPNIVSSSQSFGTKSYEPSSSMPLISTSTDATHAAIARTSQVASSSQPSAHRTPHCSSSHQSQTSQPKSSLPMIISGSGTCILTSSRCPLTNCIFLLSPCISSTPYITQNLLSWHGSRVVRSLRAFSDPALPRHCPQTGRKYRKIALVEPNRTKQTVEFLKRIEGLNLRRRRRKGKGRQRQKQWVEVYDWRLLECVAKQDRGRELGYNPWRRCWMGAV